jgi:inhibitor of KinA
LDAQALRRAMTTPIELPIFLDAGECALVVEYGRTIDPTTHERVMDLDAALTEEQIAGVLETVPTYRSLMVHYDPGRIGRHNLAVRIAGMHPLKPRQRTGTNRWTVPICYTEDYCMDLKFVAQALGLSEEKVVALHQGASYRLYMYGFAPGLAYLGGLPSELTLSRRAEPRQRLEANKAIIAGGQAAVTTVPMPNAWYVLGETPESLFNPSRSPVFLMAVADEIRFDRVDTAQFSLLKHRAEQGEVIARCEAV